MYYFKKSDSYIKEQLTSRCSTNTKINFKLNRSHVMHICSQLNTLIFFFIEVKLTAKMNVLFTEVNISNYNLE